MKKNDLITTIHNKHKTHIIFDFDETLCTLAISWEPYWFDGVQKLLEQFGYTKSGSDEETTLRILINRYAKTYGNSFWDKFLALNYDIEKNYYHGYSKHPQALALLSQLAKTMAVSLWTSNDKRTVLPILDALHFTSLFTSIICLNDVSFSKPDPDGFHRINTKNLPLDTFLLIGDSKSDEKAAQTAGIDFFNIQSLEGE